MRKWSLLILSVTMLMAGSACSNETEKPAEAKKEIVEKKEVKKEETKKEGTKKADGYTADDAYTWLKESGLVSGEAKDVTEKFAGSEGLVKAVRTAEADIFEFEKDEYAAKYHKPEMDSYAVECFA